jgi:hypothetical protein
MIQAVALTFLRGHKVKVKGLRRQLQTAHHHPAISYWYNSLNQSRISLSTVPCCSCVLLETLYLGDVGQRFDMVKIIRHAIATRAQEDACMCVDVHLYVDVRTTASLFGDIYMRMYSDRFS